MSIPIPPENNVQERIERSILEAIRLTLVAHGYLPDITTFANTAIGEASRKAALADIQGGGIEVFGHGSSLSKGIEAVPRIVLITRRIMPGDIGKSVQNTYRVDPLDPDNVVQFEPPYESSNLHIDIEVVSNKAAHDRILHAILAESIGGTMGFIKVYDSNNERFFIRQFNFYDLPDTENGIEKKVYSYDIPDIYLTETMVSANVPLIQELTTQLYILKSQAKINADLTVIGPYQSDGKIFIDLSGVIFEN